jgi:hypothetical protein
VRWNLTCKLLMNESTHVKWTEACGIFCHQVRNSTLLTLAARGQHKIPLRRGLSLTKMTLLQMSADEGYLTQTPPGQLQIGSYHNPLSWFVIWQWPTQKLRKTLDCIFWFITKDTTQKLPNRKHAANKRKSEEVAWSSHGLSWWHLPTPPPCVHQPGNSTDPFIQNLQSSILNYYLSLETGQWIQTSNHPFTYVVFLWPDWSWHFLAYPQSLV